jgi:mono/diheme cytochrome c family protein
VVGIVGVVVLGGLVGGPLVVAKQGDLPLERVYGDVAVSIASRIGGGDRQNPVSSDRRALSAGRDAYTGSCGVCHGATGDGRGVFGTSSYPNATDLRSHDAVEKSDAQLYWIIQNGLNFTGMPGFRDQYSDQDIWPLVTYIRALQDPSRVSQPEGAGQPGGTARDDRGRGNSSPGGGGNGRGEGGGLRGAAPSFSLAAIDIAVPTTEQLDLADPFSSEPRARGASVYFAQGCHLCHGAVGEAPGDLGLAHANGPEATRAIREGRPGMPRYTQAQLSETELADLQACLGTIGSSERRVDR